MNSKLLPILLLSFSFIFCKTDKKIDWQNEMNFAASKTQVFDITVGKDTVLICKGGSKIHFSPQTFITDAKSFKLEIKEALTKGDMIAFGLSTNADNGVLLETSGMIQVKPIEGQNITINPNAPIKVEMPAKFLDEKVRLYTEGVKTDNTFTWKEAGVLNNDSMLNRIKSGKSIFDGSCANCHSKKLDEQLTGPALAHVQKRRPMDWLIGFTRNSQEMIYKATLLLVLILKETYIPCVMSKLIKGVL
jgi:hypothetical protein